MTEIDHQKLASLMGAGRPPAPDPKHDRSISTILLSLAAVGAVAAGKEIIDLFEVSQNIAALRAFEPYHKADPVGSLGLQEVVSVRRSEHPNFNVEFSRAYLSDLLASSPATEVIARQWDYKSRLDAQGIPTPDQKISILQALVMGPKDTDGLFGTKTALAFRHVLSQVNAERTEAQKIAIPSSDAPLALTTEMAREIINWRVMHNRTAAKTVQQGLSLVSFSIGVTGTDGIIGPTTMNAIEAFGTQRGLNAQGKVDLPSLVAAIVEMRPAARTELADEVKGSDWYKLLPSGWQERLGNTITTSPSSEFGSLRYLLRSPGFTQVPSSLQCKLLQVFDTTDSEGKCHLVNLCHRRMGEQGKLALLCSAGEIEDGRPKVVADYLYDLAVEPMVESDEPRRAEILSSCLAELDPFNVNQGPWGRCTADSIHFDLNLRYPAEAAKLVVECFSRDQRVMDQNGTVYELPPEDGYNASQSISPTEARIHSFFLEAASPVNRYDLKRDCQVDPLTGERVGASMSGSRVAELISAFSGEEHICYSSRQGISDPVLALLLRECRPGDKFSYLVRLMTPQEVAELSEKERGGRQEIWASHIVNFVNYDQDRGEVLFRTWGRAPAPNGTVIPSDGQTLAMRVVDEFRGIYAVSIADLAPKLLDVIVRKTPDTIDPNKIDSWKFRDLLSW